MGILFNSTALGIHFCETSLIFNFKTRLGGEIYLSDVNMHKGYLSLNASHIHYTHHFLRRCKVQVLDTFRYAANEFYSKIFFTVYSRLLI